MRCSRHVHFAQLNISCSVMQVSAGLGQLGSNLARPCLGQVKSGQISMAEVFGSLPGRNPWLCNCATLPAKVLASHFNGTSGWSHQLLRFWAMPGFRSNPEPAFSQPSLFSFHTEASCLATSSRMSSHCSGQGAADIALQFLAVAMQAVLGIAVQLSSVSACAQLSDHLELKSSKLDCLRMRTRGAKGHSSGC
jgi:hypothetical protein